jgi:uncharacterized membrane protein YczE
MKGDALMDGCALGNLNPHTDTAEDLTLQDLKSASIVQQKHIKAGALHRIFPESKLNMFVRIALLMVGIPVMSLGINIIVSAGLGNSPISATPYVAHLAWPGFSFGAFLAFWHIILIAGQILILRRDFRASDLLQIPVTIYFGLTTDLTALPLAGLQSTNYAQSLLFLAGGIGVLALGISFLLVSNTVMNCGEAFVRALTIKSHKKFGTLKVCVDLSFVACATLLSLTVFGHIEGVREGSFICAACTGLVVNLITPQLTKIIFNITSKKEVTKTSTQHA